MWNKGQRRRNRPMYAPPPYFDHDNPSLSAAPFTSFVPLPPSYFLFDYSFFLPEPSGPRQGFDLPKLQPPVGPLKDNTANPYYTFPVSLRKPTLHPSLEATDGIGDSLAYCATALRTSYGTPHLKGRRSGYMRAACVEVIKKQHAASV